MENSTEVKKRYFTETALALRREGYTVEDAADDCLKVSMSGNPLCSVTVMGGITYRQENLSSPELEERVSLSNRQELDVQSPGMTQQF